MLCCTDWKSEWKKNPIERSCYILFSNIILDIFHILCYFMQYFIIKKMIPCDIILTWTLALALNSIMHENARTSLAIRSPGRARCGSTLITAPMSFNSICRSRINCICLKDNIYCQSALDHSYYVNIVIKKLEIKQMIEYF